MHSYNLTSPVYLSGSGSVRDALFIFAIRALIILSVFLCLKQPLSTGSRAISPKSVSAAVVLNDCSKETGISKVICLAENLKTLLTDAQRAKLQLAYTKTDAVKWSNFPATFRGAARVGLNFGSMTAPQIQAAKALIKEAAGTTRNEGWDELQQLLNADDYLATNDDRGDYGAANYYLAFLGTPGKTGLFEIQYGGHHVAFANTYKNGVLSGATPSFRGVEPFGKFKQNGTDNQPMNQEQEALSAMLTGLSADELVSAKLNSTYSDLVAGPHQDNKFPAAPSGIKCDRLNSARQKLVLAAINTYVDDIADADAAVFMKKYTKELGSTYIAYSGTTSMTSQNDYVRIDGPSVWIEYSCQHGIVTRGTHPHSVWRDKLKDYGGN